MFMFIKLNVLESFRKARLIASNYAYLFHPILHDQLLVLKLGKNLLSGGGQN